MFVDMVRIDDHQSLWCIHKRDALSNPSQKLQQINSKHDKCSQDGFKELDIFNITCYLRYMEVDWDKLVDEGVSKIPAKFQSKIKNVAVLLEDKPSPEVRKREGLSADETLLGLYHGVPVSERGEGYGIGETLPDTITLYKNPILEIAQQTDGDVGRVVAETIWHEFGHHLGLDEHEVREREAEKGWG